MNKRKILVMKFGGTSVGSADAIRQTAQIVRDSNNGEVSLVVVVSAMNGVTNLLLNSARAASEGDHQQYLADIERIREKQLNAVAGLELSESEANQLRLMIDEFINQLRNYCQSIAILGEVTPRGLDAIASLGERMNARLVSAQLCALGLSSQAIDADRLIVTDNAFQHANPLKVETTRKTREVILPLLEDGIVPVVTGFIAATSDGITTTLGRGGSDYTAAILGDALDASEVWTWTDVDGVMTADPSIVKDARVISDLTFDEVSEMAYFGAKVLHPKTMRPLIEKNIPIRVKNTFNPQAPGTCISQDAQQKPGKISCVTAIRDVSLITVRGRGMLGVPGVAARTFSAVAAEKASVLMISQSSSEQSICFVIPDSDVRNVIGSLENELAFEMGRGDIDAVSALRDVVIVTAIGAGMRHTPGVSARIFKALGEENINVIAIAQGSSEYSISMIVASHEADQTVRQIHREVVINGH
jgi:aspartate kinase